MIKYAANKNACEEICYYCAQYNLRDKQCEQLSTFCIMDLKDDIKELKNYKEATNKIDLIMNDRQYFLDNETALEEIGEVLTDLYKAVTTKEEK